MTANRMTPPVRPSETSKHRDRLAPYCQGYGVDVGFGGDPITRQAIRMDLQRPYAPSGDGVQLGGDCRNLIWFADGVLDYVYSSHVLEDFDAGQTVPILQEWARVLKEGGHLVLLQPDQQRYLAYCQKHGEPPNAYHAVDQFSLEYLLEAAKKSGCLEPVASEDKIDEYSFFVVFAKRNSANASAPPTNEDLQAEIKWLRHEMAKTEKNYQDASNRLDEYRNHPLIKPQRVAFQFLKRLVGKS